MELDAGRSATNNVSSFVHIVYNISHDKIGGASNLK